MKRMESAGRGEGNIGWLLGSDEADLWLREERDGAAAAAAGAEWRRADMRLG